MACDASSHMPADQFFSQERIGSSNGERLSGRLHVSISIEVGSIECSHLLRLKKRHFAENCGSVARWLNDQCLQFPRTQVDGVVEVER